MTGQKLTKERSDRPNNLQDLSIDIMTHYFYMILAQKNCI